MYFSRKFGTFFVIQIIVKNIAMKLYSALTILTSLIIGTSCTKDIGPNPDLLPKPIGACDTIKFSVHIQPIITNSCVSCHFPGGSGNGDFTSFTDIKAKADNGSLMNRVITLHNMPQSGPLSNEEITLVQCWLNNGAPNN